MKSLVFILTLFCFGNVLSSQSTIEIPVLKGSDVVVELYDCYEASYLSVSDGIIDTYKYQFPTKWKDNDFPKTLSVTITQLKNQGYKLVSTVAASNGNSTCAKTYYIFEKN